mmetsp:Transcript_27638/g.53699  ORF Transcript_27638/g.53699 Transcript_27638/m.53699 type:complete len:99 (+) Transcript_27638:1185-1481(+)
MQDNKYNDRWSLQTAYMITPAKSYDSTGCFPKKLLAFLAIQKNLHSVVMKLLVKDWKLSKEMLKEQSRIRIKSLTTLIKGFSPLTLMSDIKKIKFNTR